jgi:DNA repair protein RecO (recombination protein O)
MGIYKAEAIVLRSMVYGEADRILTLFTRETGKVGAIAKGVRKPSSRLRGAVQLFSHTHLVLYAGRTLDTVTQGEAEETFGFIEDDLDWLAAASSFTELVDRLTMDKQPLPKLFQLLLTALRALEGSDPELLTRVFEAKLLSVLGYRPQLEGCVMGDHGGWQPPPTPGANIPRGVPDWQTGAPESGRVWFSIERGGVLCPDCARLCPGAMALAPDTVAALAYFLRAPLDRAARARVEQRSRSELASFLQSFIAYHGDVRPRSWQFSSPQPRPQQNTQSCSQQNTQPRLQQNTQPHPQQNTQSRTEPSAPR